MHGDLVLAPALRNRGIDDRQSKSLFSSMGIFDWGEKCLGYFRRKNIHKKSLKNILHKI